jgi:hypothetical protein
MCMMIHGADDHLWLMKIWCVQCKRIFKRTDDSPFRLFSWIFHKFHGHFFTKLCLINFVSENCVHTGCQRCLRMNTKWTTDVVCLVRVLWCFMTMPAHTLPPQLKIALQHLAQNNSDIPSRAQTLRQVIFMCSCIWKLSLVAGDSTTRSKKPLTCGLHHRQHHSTMLGYKNWCPATTSALTIVETTSKSRVTYVHQMAINSPFFNSPTELTFWITYILLNYCVCADKSKCFLPTFLNLKKKNRLMRTPFSVSV